MHPVLEKLALHPTALLYSLRQKLIELIRPILKVEKTPKQVSEEEIPLSNIYRYLKRLPDGGEDFGHHNLGPL